MRSTFRLSLVLGLAGAALFLSHTAHAAISVQQVEGGYAQYAPIDFNGSSTVAGAGLFAGLTFHAQGATATSTYSSHAQTVASNFYGTSSVAHNYINNVFNDGTYNNAYTLGFYPQIVRTASIPANYYRPLYFYGGTTAPSGSNIIRVTNHSYIFSYTTSNSDLDAIRRLNYMTAREDTVMVAGAASESVTAGVTTNFNLIWAVNNAISVRGALYDGGAGTLVYFHPTNPTGPGKRRADLWQDNLPSFASGTVSGYAAALIGRSEELAGSYLPAGHSQVVRSLLLTGADKSVVITTSGSESWSRETANNLDVEMGAGKADYNKSKAILEAGARSIATVNGGNVLTSPTVYTNTQGWAYATSLTSSGQQALLLQVAPGKAISNLTATLAWNYTATETTYLGGNGLDTSKPIESDLGLRLVHVTYNAGAYTLGSDVGYVGLSSNVTGDNIEHLYWTSGANPALGPGYYALVVTGDPSNKTSLTAAYGLSYSYTAIPEPASFALLLLGAAALTRRRRA